MSETYSYLFIKKLLQNLKASDSPEVFEKTIQILNKQIEGYLDKLNECSKDLEKIWSAKTLADRRKQFKDFKQAALDNQKNDNQKRIQYKKLTRLLSEGYLIVNRIRDLFVGEIVYHIGYQRTDATGKIKIYEATLKLEDLEYYLLKKEAGYLSSRVKATKENLARLEINLTDKLKDKITEINDVILDQILAYTNYTNSKGARNRHKYYKNDKNSKSIWVGKSHNGYEFTGGNLWEVYNYYKVRKREKITLISQDSEQPPDDAIEFHRLYEYARRGNLPYTKGGDILNEQDKFTQAFALTSMKTIVTTLTQLKTIFNEIKNPKQMIEGLKQLFIQKTPPEADEELNKYIQKEVDHLIEFIDNKTKSK